MSSSSSYIGLWLLGILQIIKIPAGVHFVKDSHLKGWSFIQDEIRLMLIMARSAERRARFSYFAARCALSMLIAC
jgi:hypothetical protein